LNSCSALAGGKQKFTAMLLASLAAALTGSSPVGGSSRIPDAHCRDPTTLQN